MNSGELCLQQLAKAVRGNTKGKELSIEPDWANLR